MSAANASVLTTVLTHNGVQLGIATQLTVNQDATPSIVKDQGDLGNTSVGIIGRDGTATVSWLGGVGQGLITPGTPGSLVETTVDNEGGATQTRTATVMVAMGGSYVHVDKQVALYTQQFINKSKTGVFFTGS